MAKGSGFGGSGRVPGIWDVCCGLRMYWYAFRIVGFGLRVSDSALGIKGWVSGHQGSEKELRLAVSILGFADC